MVVCLFYYWLNVVVEQTILYEIIHKLYIIHTFSIRNRIGKGIDNEHLFSS